MQKFNILIKDSECMEKSFLLMIGVGYVKHIMCGDV
jgi:hypothetical protein